MVYKVLDMAGRIRCRTATLLKTRCIGRCSSLLTTRYSSSHQLSEITCWKCSKLISTQENHFMCPCEHHVILPPTVTNYFLILQCNSSFDIDTNMLKKCYHRLQIQLHPDKYALKSSLEKQYADEHSSLVNKAYNTLLNPYTRGLYLLELQGISIDERDNTASVIGEHDFLERIMSINEELQSDLSQERLQELKSDNEVILEECLSSVSKCFKNGDLIGAKANLSKMKYFINIKQDLINKIKL